MAKAAKTIHEIATIRDTIPAPAETFGMPCRAGLPFSDEMSGLSAVFEQIRIPIGGAIYFGMPGDDPEAMETVREFQAVILHHHPMRAFYREKYTGGNAPPDCGSLDGMTGSGNPGGVCAHCPYDRFGTGENGAKACKERRRLYLLLQGEAFPMVLSLPTGSLREFSRYLMRCLPKWGKSSAGITRFSLAKAMSKGGIAYTRVQFRMERPLSEEETERIEPLVMNVKAVSQKLAMGVAWEETEDAAPAIEADDMARSA